MFHSRSNRWFGLAIIVAVVGEKVLTVSGEDPSPSEKVALALDQVDDLLDGWSRLEKEMDAVLQSADEVFDAFDELKQRREAFNETQQRVQETWTAWNKQQLENLQEELQNVLDAETARRENATEQVEEYKRKKDHLKKQKEQAAAGKPIEKLPPKSLTRAEVDEILSPETFMKERDETVGKWISQLLEQSMRTRGKPKWEWAEDIVLPAPTDDAPSKSPTAAVSDKLKDEQGCWTLLDAVVHIQESLANYSQGEGVGVTDHAQNGRISHHDTSPTYNPQPEDETTWGSSFMRKYVIAEDWEEFVLPHFDQWQDWPLLPSWISSSHGWKRILGTPTTAPPETVLQGATWPGACWPMQGKSGHVTIVLPYAIYPTAISIDHVSPLLVSKRNSAPKHMRVLAYEACEDNNCNGLEYDERGTFDLFRGRTIEYDVNGNSVQTFWMPPADSPAKNDEKKTGSCSAPMEEEEEDEEEPVAASCGGAEYDFISPTTRIRAVKLQILDNWGNGDYTCLYRIRVHGIPVS